MRGYTIAWTLALGSLLFCGCSSYQEVLVRTDATRSEIGEAQVETVAVGDAVRVTTQDGDRYSGTIASRSVDLLVLYLSGGNAHERREFASSEIVKLEKKIEESGVGGLILIGAVVLIVWIASKSAGIGFGGW